MTKKIVGVLILLPIFTGVIFIVSEVGLVQFTFKLLVSLIVTGLVLLGIHLISD